MLVLNLPPLHQKDVNVRQDISEIRMRRIVKLAMLSAKPAPELRVTNAKLVILQLNLAELLASARLAISLIPTLRPALLATLYAKPVRDQRTTPVFLVTPLQRSAELIAYVRPLPTSTPQQADA
jgi:hypothetical protein